ncbi:MAG: rhodanese-like domain-containing protein [Gammaproteobacteria bacterium]|nr:rhodanese-like domain-containing protein [Gammaproteobacteria bacterium]MBU1777006.1 rhodanese-like domain-containing protein [Gammaproteobacteria bacterium]
MKTKIYIALAAVFGLALMVQQLQAGQAVPTVDVKQAQVMVAEQGALLLDVREPAEYAAVHAVNAKLIPLGEVSRHLKELESFKDKPIAVICRSGRRSAEAVGILQQAGLRQAVNVQGGTNAWLQAGLEVVKQQ